MRHFPIFALVAIILSSCSGSTDCGRTFTNVNKCMTLFGEDGKVELVQPEPGVKDMVWTTVRANTKPDIVWNGEKLPNGVMFKGICTADRKVDSGDQYTMMETDKNSMVVGVNLFLNSETECSMEACLRAYNTRTGKAEYLSSGLEDFFLSTYRALISAAAGRGPKDSVLWVTTM